MASTNSSDTGNDDDYEYNSDDTESVVDDTNNQNVAAQVPSSTLLPALVKGAKSNNKHDEEEHYFIDDVDDFRCVICSSIFVEPITLLCCQRKQTLCKKCLLEWMEKSGQEELECPFCRCENIRYEEDTIATVNINKILISCKNNAEPHTTLGIKRSNDGQPILHLQMVELLDENCSINRCPWIGKQSDWEHHDQNECRLRILLYKEINDELPLLLRNYNGTNETHEKLQQSISKLEKIRNGIRSTVDVFKKCILLEGRKLFIGSENRREAHWASVDIEGLRKSYERDGPPFLSVIDNQMMSLREKYNSITKDVFSNHHDLFQKAMDDSFINLYDTHRYSYYQIDMQAVIDAIIIYVLRLNSQNTGTPRYIIFNKGCQTILKEKIEKTIPLDRRNYQQIHMVFHDRLDSMVTRGIIKNNEASGYVLGQLFIQLGF